MNFSDKELKELKKDCQKYNFSTTYGMVDLKPLIHRLECAERLIKFEDKFIDFTNERAYKAWLKSKSDEAGGGKG